MPRLEYPDLSTPDAALEPVLAEIAKGRPFVPNVYRMLLWSPEAAAGWVAMANAVRFESGLDDRSRELAILLVSEITGCEYEWHHHSRIAETVGVAPEEVERIRAWPDLSAWPAEDRALLSVIGSIVEREPLPHGELETLRERLDEKAFVELSATVAYYLGLSHFLLALEVEVEPDGANLGDGR